jgi:hypothetical protein
MSIGAKGMPHWIITTVEIRSWKLLLTFRDDRRLIGPCVEIDYSDGAFGNWCRWKHSEIADQPGETKC